MRLVDQALTLPQLPSPLPTVLTVFPFLAVGGAERVALDVMQPPADQVRWVVVALEPADERLGTTADRFRNLTPYVYTAPDFLAHPLLYSLLVHLIGRFAPATLYRQRVRLDVARAADAEGAVPAAAHGKSGLAPAPRMDRALRCVAGRRA